MFRMSFVKALPIGVDRKILSTVLSFFDKFTALACMSDLECSTMFWAHHQLYH